MARRAITQKVLKRIIGVPVIPKMISPKIKIIGAARLKPQEGRAVKEMMNESLNRIQKNYIPKFISFVCQIKNYEKGKRTKEKRSIHLKLITPAMVFKVDDTSYHLSTAVSRAIKVLERDIRRFKEKIRERYGSFKGKGRRIVSRKRQLELARAKKMKTLRARGERRRLGKVFPPRIKR